MINSIQTYNNTLNTRQFSLQSYFMTNYVTSPVYVGLVNSSTYTPSPTEKSVGEGKDTRILNSPEYVRLEQTPSPNLGEGWGEVSLPSGSRNYTIVNQNKADYFVSQKEGSLPYLADILRTSNDEKQIVETLYILNKMLDEGVKGVDKMYPVLSRFNNTQSPNIQTFLAGIYRKTQVPDAFGPLVKMLIQNSLHPQTSNFDPNEEIGGAILSYINPRFKN